MNNTHLLDGHKEHWGTVALPKEDISDMYYACEWNTERNFITTSIFRDYINVTHPCDKSNIDLIEVSKNAVVVESAMYDTNKERYSTSFE